MAVDGAGGALLSGARPGGELDPGADGADVGLGEELRVRQGDRERGDVGIACAGLQDRGQGRVAAAPGRALELQGQLGLEVKAAAGADLEAV